MSTKIYIFSKIRKNNVHPCKPQFYYIKVGLTGFKIILACLRDVLGDTANATLHLKQNLPLCRNA